QHLHPLPRPAELHHEAAATGIDDCREGAALPQRLHVTRGLMDRECVHEGRRRQDVRREAPPGPAEGSTRRTPPGGRSRDPGLPLAQRAHQLLLVHAAAPLDPPLLCDVVELVLRPRFVAAVRVAGPLRRAVRGPSLLPPPFVDGAGGNLLRPVLAHPPLARALLDVLVLALVLVAPRSGHVVLRCWCGMRPPPPIPPALPRSTSSACEPR